MKPACHRESPALRHVLAALLLTGAALGPAAAQGLQPAAQPATVQDFAPAAQPFQMQPAPGATVEPAPAAPPAAEPDMVRMTPGAQVVQAFVEACVEPGGAVGPLVDWALNHGFEPLDPEGRDGTDGYALLDGRPGVVFATPDAATRVLLAATQDGSCTVWAERAAGTSTQDAFVQATEVLEARGAKLQRETDRMLERAGAWRRQLEYRLRPAGAPHDYRIGAVTTLTETPAAQALRFAPLLPPQLSSSSSTEPRPELTPTAR